VSQVIKFGKESLVQFAKALRKRQMVRILWRGFAKSHQPSDLVKKWGGYSYIRSSSSKNSESLDHHPVARQPSDSTGVAQDLIPREQSGNPEKHRDIEASGFGKSGIPWTRDRENPSWKSRQARSRPFVGTGGRNQESSVYRGFGHRGSYR
jgi:hypothetical protein